MKIGNPTRERGTHTDPSLTLRVTRKNRKLIPTEHVRSLMQNAVTLRVTNVATETVRFERYRESGLGPNSCYSLNRSTKLIHQIVIMVIDIP